uniref:Uncharacterized protein n=1 Tax=Gossypium raimondii TaxID=29730 RepID=A0A0D2PZI9_GOSRA|nr:hypothetical protein B456_005G256300 [Gossypium raimondii]
MTLLRVKCLYFQAVMLSNISYHNLLLHSHVTKKSIRSRFYVQCRYPLETKACDRQICGVISKVGMFAFIGWLTQQGGAYI